MGTVVIQAQVSGCNLPPAKSLHFASAEKWNEIKGGAKTPHFVYCSLCVDQNCRRIEKSNCRGPKSKLCP